MVTSGFNNKYKTEIDLCPTSAIDEINRLFPWLQDNITRAVYRVGLTRDQTIYEEECQSLFRALDEMENLLTNQPYLIGNNLTEADLFLFPTLARFDSIYAPLFRCSLRRIQDYPALSNYLSRLLGNSGLEKSFNMTRAKQNYFGSLIHRPDGAYEINPSGIIPL